MHENQDQNENHLAALIHKEWHFGLKKHEGKRKLRLLSMPHWPDSLQLGKLTRCSLLNSLPFSCCCCCLLYVVNKYCFLPFEYLIPKPSTFFKHFMLSICSNIESSWMDYLKFGFFLVSPNGLMLNIFCHWEQLNGSSPVRVLSCLFKWIDIEQLQSH